ncbi:hypothetical protein [Methanococcoides alaskense]|uniref:Biopolymer transport protein ExbD n=1 Tax=Methanococcoides alaskense TaxID=325778 RepID=A0AA90ZB46_9EURY|nr:hypothetical protein [Methanococcoides alaskense]MDA0525147.1 hypothetical protein [Methanococcoides alaskense]MDR6221932.1 biopolymer transport protein ExbD [Methanococcoides alaskense]
MERKPLNVKIPENIHNELDSRGENKTQATISALEAYLWGDKNVDVEHLMEKLATQEKHHELQIAEKDKHHAAQIAEKDRRIVDLKEANALRGGNTEFSKCIPEKIKIITEKTTYIIRE